jgi:hypothetical protein
MLHYFHILPRKNSFGDQIILCYLKDDGNWYYKKQSGIFFNDVLVPDGVFVYQIKDEIESLSVLAHSAVTEANGIKSLFIPNDITEKISSIPIGTAKQK